MPLIYRTSPRPLQSAAALQKEMVRLHPRQPTHPAPHIFTHKCGWRCCTTRQNIWETSKVLKLENSNLSSTSFSTPFLTSQKCPTMSPHQEALASSTSSLIWGLKEFTTLVDHYGRNTHFRRICSSVPNFNFKYEYMKFEKLRDSRRIFEEITQKLAGTENYASEEIKFTIFLLFFKWCHLS